MFIDHYIRKGNLAPQFLATPLDRTMQRIDPATLPAGTTARFWMRQVRAGVTVNKVDTSAEILTISGADGSYIKIRYQWQAGDTDTPGLYIAGVDLIDISGVPLSFPNGSNGVHVQVTDV